MIKSKNTAANQISIAIDHTGGHYSEPISHFLKSKGYEVFFLDSPKVKVAKEKLLGEENKTDKIDSATLAYLLYLRDFYKVSLQITATSADFDSRSARLRSLLLQSNYYSKLGAQTTTRLRQYVHAIFPEGEEKYFRQLLKVLHTHPTPREIVDDPDVFASTRIKRNSREEIHELARKTIGIPGYTYKCIIQDLASLRIMNKEKIAVIDQNICVLALEHPYSAILMSFPSVNEKSAATIISTVKDINNWPTKNKFKKGLAVYGIERSTGANQARFRRGISGDRMSRHALYLICLTAVHSKTENDFQDFYYKQIQSGKPKMKALVSTMGKMAEIMYHCLKTNETYVYTGAYRRNVCVKKKKTKEHSNK